MNRWQGVAVVLIVSYAFVGIWVYSVGTNAYIPYLNPAPSPAKFTLVGTFYLGQVERLNTPDLAFDLTFVSNNSVLSVNEPIYINGTAIAYSGLLKSNLKQVEITLLDGYDWPAQTQNGFPVSGPIYLNRTSVSNVFVGKAINYWQVEGNYQADLNLIFYNGTIYDAGFNPTYYVPIQPQTELTQESQNHLNLILTYALFMLTALGVVTTFRELWGESHNRRTNQIALNARRKDPNILRISPLKF